MLKKCNRCEQNKAYECFSTSRGNKDGYAALCKPCTSLRNKEYWRTPPGRLSQIFSNQVQTSRHRGHPKPSYSKETLQAWVLQHGWNTLMAQWIASDYKKCLIPSIDRKDPNYGYSLINIRLVTWEENNDKAYQDRKSCKHVTKQNRRIEQLSLDNTHIAYFDSVASAGRSTGIQRTNINAMCNGKPQYKSVGGFVWRHV